MNFCSLTTRGHSPITWTFTPHSQPQITQGLHFPSSTAPTQLFTMITLAPVYHLTITITQSHTHTHTHYLSSGLSLTHCRVLLAQLHTKRFPVSRVRFPVFPVSRVRFTVFPVSRVRFTVFPVSRVRFTVFPVSRVRFLCPDSCTFLDYSLCLALWIKFADRRPTLALGLFSALSLSYLFATVRPCLY